MIALSIILYYPTIETNDELTKSNLIGVVISIIATLFSCWFLGFVGDLAQTVGALVVDKEKQDELKK